MTQKRISSRSYQVERLVLAGPQFLAESPVVQLLSLLFLYLLDHQKNKTCSHQTVVAVTDKSNADGILKADDKQIYTAENLKVGVYKQ